MTRVARTRSRSARRSQGSHGYVFEIGVPEWEKVATRAGAGSLAAQVHQAKPASIIDLRSSWQVQAEPQDVVVHFDNCSQANGIQRTCAACPCPHHAACFGCMQLSQLDSPQKVVAWLKLLRGRMLGVKQTCHSTRPRTCTFAHIRLFRKLLFLLCKRHHGSVDRLDFGKVASPASFLCAGKRSRDNSETKI